MDKKSLKVLRQKYKCHSKLHFLVRSCDMTKNFRTLTKWNLSSVKSSYSMNFEA